MFSSCHQGGLVSLTRGGYRIIQEGARILGCVNSCATPLKKCYGGHGQFKKKKWKLLRWFLYISKVILGCFCNYIAKLVPPSGPSLRSPMNPPLSLTI